MARTRSLLTVAAALVLVALMLMLPPFGARTSTAQPFGGDDEDPVHFQGASFDKAEVNAGDTVTMSLAFHVDDPYHIYSLKVLSEWTEPTRITISDAAGLEFAEWTEPEPILFKMQGEEHGERVHMHGDVVFQSVVTVPDALGEGLADGERKTLTVRGAITTMACDDSMCLPLTDHAFEATITLIGDDYPAKLGTVAFDPNLVAAGGRTTLNVPVAMDGEWHIYSLRVLSEFSEPTKLAITEPQGLELGQWTETEPHEYAPPGAPDDKERVHEKAVTFSLPVTVPESLAEGLALGETREIEIRGTITFMACTDICLPSATREFSAMLSVTIKSDSGSTNSGELAALIKQINDRLDQIEQGQNNQLDALKRKLEDLEIALGRTSNAQAGVVKEFKKELADFNENEIEPMRAAVTAIAARLGIEVGDGSSGTTNTNTNRGNSDGNNAGNTTNNNAAGNNNASHNNTSGNSGTGNESNAEAEQKTVINLEFLLFCVGAALITLLTPCVFPMIPVTISFFTKQAEYRKKAIADAEAAGADPEKLAALPKPVSPLKLASIYALGIIVSLSVFGLILSAIAGPAFAQDLARDPWFNVGLGVLLIALALSFFGLFELRIPGFIMNALGKLTRRPGANQTGVIETFITGAIFTLAGFACTGPILALITAVALTEGQWFSAAIAMAVYSVAFASPFFLLALFPGLMQKLPRSGVWMNRVKVVMGFIELAAAVKFLQFADFTWGWGLFTREFTFALWAAILIVLGLYVMGKIAMKDEPTTQNTGPIGTIFGVTFIGIALYIIASLGGTWRMWDEFESLGAGPPSEDERWRHTEKMKATEREKLLIEFEEMLDERLGAGGFGFGGGAAGVERPPQGEYDGGWFHDLENAMTASRGAGVDMPIFVDITAHVCPNCRLNEDKYLKTDREVRGLLKKYVRVAIWTDKGANTPEEFVPYYARLQNALAGKPATPVYMIVDQNGERIGRTFEGLIDTDGGREAFVTWLEEGLVTKRPATLKPVSDVPVLQQAGSK